jgi:ABC-type transporter Mla subunit MlaD
MTRKNVNKRLFSLSALFLGTAISLQPLTAHADFDPRGYTATPSFEQQRDALNRGVLAQAEALRLQEDLNGEGHIVELPEGAGIIRLPDLTAHPLAGTEIEVEIQVYDGLEQTGRSQTIRIMLPEPFLASPLNEELADIRRELALHPEQAGELAERMEQALQEHAESLENLETREALEQLQERMEQAAQAQDTEELNEVLDEMWDAMQQVEQDALSEAEQRLNELREQLREAMENGAPQEKINELMREANEAMQELLQEQAEAAQQEGDQQAQEQFERMQEMLQEMQEMMEQMSPDQQQMSQEMMQQMMEQMQQMMQNQRMQQAGQQPQQQMSPQQMQQMMQQMQQQMQQMQEMQQMDEDLTELIEDQTELMEETIEQADLNEDELNDLVQQLFQALEKLESRAQTIKEIDTEYREMLERSYDERIAELRRTMEEAQATQEDIDTAIADERARWLSEISSDRDMTEEIDNILRRLETARTRMENQVASDTGMTVNQGVYNASLLQTLAAHIGNIEDEHPAIQQEEPEQNAPAQDGDGQDDMPPTEATPDQPQDDRMQGQPSREETRRQIEQARDALMQMRDENNALRRQQEALERDLQQIIRDAERNGLDPSALQDVLREMDDATTRLQRGDVDGAVPEQAEVIEGLRQAQQQMQQQMQQMMQQQQQQGGMPGNGQGMPMPSGGIESGDNGPGFNRANPNDFIGIDPEAEENRSRDIRDAIRERLNGDDLEPAERRYLMELLERDGPITLDAPQSRSLIAPAPRP